MLEEDEEDEEEDQICEVHEAQGGWNSIITRSVFFHINYCYCKYIQIREMQKYFFFGGGGQKREVYTKLNASCNVNFNGDLLQQEFNF